MTSNVEIGARLRAARESAKVSRAALGESLGVTYQQVAKLEKGQSGLSALQIIRAAKTLGCAPLDILHAAAKPGRKK